MNSAPIHRYQRTQSMPEFGGKNWKSHNEVKRTPFFQMWHVVYIILIFVTVGTVFFMRHYTVSNNISEMEKEHRETMAAMRSKFAEEFKTMRMTNMANLKELFAKIKVESKVRMEELDKHLQETTDLFHEEDQKVRHHKNEKGRYSEDAEWALEHNKKTKEKIAAMKKETPTWVYAAQDKVIEAKSNIVKLRNEEIEFDIKAALEKEAGQETPRLM